MPAPVLVPEPVEPVLVPAPVVLGGELVVWPVVGKFPVVGKLPEERLLSLMEKVRV